jgi:mono/diheme cytochrome c family protein
MMRGPLILSCMLVLAAPAVAQESRDGTFPHTTGEALYQNICQGCHMPDAKGATGAGRYPALANDPKLAQAGYPVSVVLHGQKAMPWFADDLSDEQVAAVVTYIRTHFGNRYFGKVKPEDVKAMR